MISISCRTTDWFEFNLRYSNGVIPSTNNFNCGIKHLQLKFKSVHIWYRDKAFMINDTLNKSSDLKLIFQFIRWKKVNFTCLKNFARIPSWMSSSASFFILNISAHISRFQKQNLDWVKVWYKYKITHRGKDLRDDGICHVSLYKRFSATVKTLFFAKPWDKPC